MRYAQTGIAAFSGAGGCPGHGYADRPDQSDPHMSVDCATCEAFLAADPLWSGNPSEVPLTDRERQAADRAREEADQLAARSVTGAAALISALAAQPGILDGLTRLLSPPAPEPPGPLPAAGPESGPEAKTPARTARKPRARVAAGTAS